MQDQVSSNVKVWARSKDAFASVVDSSRLEILEKGRNVFVLIRQYQVFKVSAFSYISLSTQLHFMCMMIA